MHSKRPRRGFRTGVVRKGLARIKGTGTVPHSLMHFGHQYGMRVCSTTLPSSSPDPPRALPRRPIPVSAYLWLHVKPRSRCCGSRSVTRLAAMGTACSRRNPPTGEESNTIGTH